MKSGITFGVCFGERTAWNNEEHIIANIALQNAPEWEVIFVGPAQIPEAYKDDKRIMVNSFNETLRDKGWITKKKNIITDMASYDTIVYLHDYVRLDKFWWAQWMNFDTSFDVAINRVLIQERQGEEIYRHSDWIIQPKLLWELYPHLHWKFWDLSLPYYTRGLSKLQYISGGYWVAKREFMKKFRLNEALTWGESEDNEWSERVRQATDFVLNPDASVWISKPGKWKPGMIPQQYLDALCQHHNLQPSIQYEPL